MTAFQMLVAQIASNIVALLMLIVAWRRPRMGRLLFVLLFLWAGQVNLRTAIARPHVYLEYAPLAWSGVYRRFILGFFARHVTPIVTGIAAAQILIAVSVALRGVLVRIGLGGAIVFLVAIAPLGTGSGFPATLIMALAAALLLRVDVPNPLWARLWPRTSSPGVRSARAGDLADRGGAQ